MDNSKKSNANLIDDAFGANLRYWRELRNLTQANLNDELVSRGFDSHAKTILLIEKGRRRCLIGEAVALAEILNVPLDRLTEVTPDSQQAALAQLQKSARLQLEALDRALNALADIEVTQQALKLDVENLANPNGPQEMRNTRARIRKASEPLTTANLEPLTTRLEKMRSQALAAITEFEK